MPDCQQRGYASQIAEGLALSRRHARWPPARRRHVDNAEHILADPALFALVDLRIVASAMLRFGSKPECMSSNIAQKICFGCPLR
jgi:hypothetical protein